MDKFRFRITSIKKEVKMAGKVLLSTDIHRETGKLYYCSTDSKGNVTVCCSDMARGGKKKSKKSKK